MYLYPLKSHVARRLFTAAFLLVTAPVLPMPAAATTPDPAALFLESLQVTSEEKAGRLSAQVAGTLPVDFKTLADVLENPASWCEFIPLNFNVKACLFKEGELQIYISRKFYDPPENAHLLRYRFERVVREEGRLLMVLTCKNGPAGTKDFRLELEARPAPAGSELRLVSSHRQSLISRVATNAYLSSSGRHKIGFSVTGEDGNGRPVYVKGIKAMVERTVVRYFFALSAYLETGELPPQERFAARLNTWFSQSEKFPQLQEMPREQYIQAKMKERENQERLQRQAARGTAATPAG